MSRIHSEPRVYKHSQLMQDYNTMQIQIKAYLFNLDGLKHVHTKPTVEEIDEMSHRVMAALGESSEPAVKRKAK